jgi:hypothetical protein
MGHPKSRHNERSKNKGGPPAHPPADVSPPVADEDEVVGALGGGEGLG